MKLAWTRTLPSTSTTVIVRSVYTEPKVIVLMGLFIFFLPKGESMFIRVTTETLTIAAENDLDP